MSRHGKLKVTDFGISIALTGTKTGAITGIGTRHYASLEVLQGKKYDYSVDIWSLGCIIHELCCWNPPYVGDTEYQQITLINAQSYDPKILPGGYSDNLRQLIAGMLERDPKKRINSSQILITPFITDYLANLINN